VGYETRMRGWRSIILHGLAISKKARKKVGNLIGRAKKEATAVTTREFRERIPKNKEKNTNSAMRARRPGTKGISFGTERSKGWKKSRDSKRLLTRRGPLPSWGGQGDPIWGDREKKD